MLLCLTGCGDNLHVADGYGPAVDSADVSILYPLPDTVDLLIQPAEEAAFGRCFRSGCFRRRSAPSMPGRAISTCG